MISLPTQKSFKAKSIKDHICVFYGPPGVGKTTFVNAFADRVLFLSTDRGTEDQWALRYPCHSYPDFEKALQLLNKPRAASQYDLVCIDHVDDFYQMTEEHVLNELNIGQFQDAAHGQGWKRYKDSALKIILGLLRLNLGMVFIAHEMTASLTIDGTKVTVTQPSMGKIAWNQVIPKAGIVGYCSVKRTQKGGKAVHQRVLEVWPRTDLVAKDRSRRRKPAQGSLELLDGERFIKTWKGTGNVGNRQAETQRQKQQEEDFKEEDVKKENGPKVGKRGRAKRTGKRGRRAT